MNKGRSLQDMLEGGLTAACVTVPAIHSATPPPNFRGAINEIAERLHWLAKYHDKGLLATSTSHIKKAKQEGIAAVIFSPQNMNILERNLELLRVLYRLGVRVGQLAYNYRNDIGYGVYEHKDCGLSDFGFEVVEEMNKMKMVIDVSHCSRATTEETIKVSSDPVVISHANVHSLCSHPRNKTDEQIHALAENGGVMGITALSTFCMTDNTQPTIEDVLDHVDYVINLVGVDHVGLGTDIDETMTEQRWDAFKRFSGLNLPENLTCYAKGFDGFKSYFNITKGLVARGYSDREISKVLGGNFLRVFKEVWNK